MINQQKKNQFLIVLIFGMSLVPLGIAWLLSANSSLFIKGTNNGQLIVPPLPTDRNDFIGYDNFSTTNLAELPGRWLMVNVILKPTCEDICLDAILKTKQIRVMLNKELSRTRRVVLLFDADVATETAKQWWLKDSLLWRLHLSKDPNDAVLYQNLLHQDRPLDEALVSKLIGNDNREFALGSDLIRIKPSNGLIKKFQDNTGGALTDGMLFLIDPLGNLMMRYDPGFDPYKVKNDLMHLLKISQIG